MNLGHRMIELRHLRQFIAVAEELSFRRAAERIHMDQTSLSRTVRDLENLMGVVLLIRMPRKLRLTPAGECLLNEARKLFIQLERTKRVVRATNYICSAHRRGGRYRAPSIIAMLCSMASGCARDAA